MIEYNQNKVSRAVWPWTAEDSCKHTSGFPFSAIPALLIGGSVSAIFFYTGHPVPAAIAGILSLFLFCTALFLPDLYGRIRLFLSTYSHYVGQGMSWLLLVPFFYLFFPLGRLVQKIRGNDPMHRTFPAARSSCWLDKQAVDDTKQYLRQF